MVFRCWTTLMNWSKSCRLALPAVCVGSRYRTRCGHPGNLFSPTNIWCQQNLYAVETRLVSWRKDFCSVVLHSQFHCKPSVHSFLCMNKCMCMTHHQQATSPLNLHGHIGCLSYPHIRVHVQPCWTFVIIIRITQLVGLRLMCSHE